MLIALNGWHVKAAKEVLIAKNFFFLTREYSVPAAREM